MTQEEKKISSLKVLNNEASVSSPAVNTVEGAGKVSRRRFLQILGATTAVGAAGCADKATQNIFPNVKGDDQQIPGESVWYSSTCTECAAGCGIQVRTREGRAVKIEGNADHPVNQGGLCALGQSSLQALYDPDRIRQPLKKNGKSFEPITWDAAYAQLAEWLKNSKKSAILTSEISGALQELLNDFSESFQSDHFVWDLLQPTAVAQASEATFGVYGIPHYDFEKADTLVNFGADFLETWVSPCEYARGWAKSRKSKKPIRVVHVEPRLSLTGANADLWISAKPGTEVFVAAAVLKLLLDQGRGGEYKSGAQKVVAGLNIDAVCEQTGVSLEKLSLVTQYLAQSSNPLVISGGTVGSGDNAYELSVVCNLINLVLGSVGKTIVLSKTRAVKTSVSRIKSLVAELNTGNVDLFMVHDTNPVFSLPASFNFKYAMKKAAHIVSFSSHLDETSELADLILPANTGLESWGDQRIVDGIYSLQQPSMTPVFDTKDFSDSLITVSEKAGKSIAAASGKDFKSYLKESWKKVHAKAGSQGAFEDFWKQSLERGGYFQPAKSDSSNGSVNAKAYDVKLKAVSFSSSDSAADIAVYPFSSVKSFDGRAANRPWLQEMPDPITQISWDSWAEINPKTAKSKGLAQGDMVTIRNNSGELNLPVYITSHVNEGIVAVPIGQGHTSYGRFAKKVSGGNVLDLISDSKESNDKNINIFSARAEIIRGRGKSDVVVVQGSDSQHGRELARTKYVTAAGLAASDAVHTENGHSANGSHAGHEAHGGGAHGAHHEPKQMYEQRGHPLYKWAMAIDLATCTGCTACVVACYAENNIPVVGKARMSEGREMSWLRIERYYEGEAEELKVSFLPMMCQQCGNAPCEPVCPVYATYHNEEGLNAMIYNRCVGTRYCSNNCSYKVRRFNWFEYELPAPMEMQLNPDVMKRVVGVMEKCTFCVQRIAEGKDNAKDQGRPVKDGEIQPACVQSCPSGCMTFGNLNDPESEVSKLAKDERAYKVLDHHLNTQPSISYLENIRYKV